MKSGNNHKLPRAARLAGKSAVVTGASRGIGLAIARALAAEGCSLLLAGRNQAGLDHAYQEMMNAFNETVELGREYRKQRGLPVPDPGEDCSANPELTLYSLGFFVKYCDVRDERSVRSLFRFFRKEFGKKLDFLINNAGIAHPLHKIEDLPLAVWREVLDTNLTGMFLCTRAALPLMGRGGAIVNNLSVAARGVFPGESAYGASKHGALGLTETLREEVRGRGIRVVALMPGPTATGIWDQFMPDAPRDQMMSPDTVARVVVETLCLPENATVEEIRMEPTKGNL